MAYLEGQLRGNVADESEGEHTGYVLEVEVDMSAVQNAQEILGEQVALTGEVEIVDYLRCCATARTSRAAARRASSGSAPAAPPRTPAGSADRAGSSARSAGSRR